VAILGLGQQLPDAFVVHKEERLVLFHWAAETASRLIPAERNDIRIEEPAPIHRAISYELVGGAMKTVGARLAHRVDHRAVAAELRAVGIGQRLELRHGLHSER